MSKNENYRAIGGRFVLAAIPLACGRAEIRRVLTIIAWVCCALCLPQALAAGDSRLVLVASASSPLAALTPAEVRRLYLGVTLTHGGREIVALRNAENPAVKEKFLQHVLFMSAQAYERQISARPNRAGGNRIPEIREVQSLLDSLAADPLAVTYMPADSVARRPRLKVLAEL